MAMGTGGSGAARARDPAASAYNPAAAVAQPGLSAAAGLVLASPRLSAQGDDLDVATGGLSAPPMLLHLAVSALSARAAAGLRPSSCVPTFCA